MRALPHIVCAISLLALGGCGALDGPSSRGDGDSATDAGSIPSDASSSVDAFGSLPDIGAGPPATWDSGPLPAEANFDSSGGSGARTSCFNFIDDDMNGAADCADPTCDDPLVNTACCVASTASACCVDAAPDVVRARALCSGVASRCLEVAGRELLPTLGTVYSSELLPEVCSVMPGLGFAPIGTDSSHGFLPLPGTYAPASSYITISGRIGVANLVDPRVTAAGFGLFAPQGLGAIARPLVGVVASATSDDVRVIVGDRVIHTEPLTTDPCGRSWQYQLRLSPDGAFEVFRREPAADGSEWGMAFAGGSYDVVRAATVALFGQQPNPMAGGPAAWVSDVRVDQSGCDLLAPARRPDAVVAAGTTNDVTGISVFPRNVAAGSYDALVTSGGVIYWMNAPTSGLLTSGSADPFQHSIQPDWMDHDRFQDVEVLLDGSTHHAFVAAARVGEASFRILHAVYRPASGSGPGSLSSPPTEILSADDFDDTMAGLDAVSVDGVTALRRTGGVGIVLAVRVRYADGTTAIRIAPETVLDTAAGFESASPRVVGRGADGTTTDGLVAASQTGEPTAFDRDEVADPQLVEEGGVVRVLYAGRRGTRWSLGMIVASPDFTHFAPADRAPFLGPSGSGFDALGVTEPFLLRREGVDRLYYAGTDGARRSIGLATQPVVGTR